MRGEGNDEVRRRKGSRRSWTGSAIVHDVERGEARIGATPVNRRTKRGFPWRARYAQWPYAASRSVTRSIGRAIGNQRKNRKKRKKERKKRKSISLTGTRVLSNSDTRALLLARWISSLNETRRNERKGKERKGKQSAVGYCRDFCV